MTDWFKKALNDAQKGIVRPPEGWVLVKLGTVPKLVKFDRRFRFFAGCEVRYWPEGGDRWYRGMADSIDPIKIAKGFSER